MNANKQNPALLPIVLGVIGAVLVLALALAIVSNLEKSNTYGQGLPSPQNSGNTNAQGTANTTNTSAGSNPTNGTSGSGSGSGSPITCFDADQGLNYYVSAYVSLLKKDGSLVNKSADYCVAGQYKSLVEYYCDRNVLSLKKITCGNRCLGGACIPSSGGGGSGPACGNGVCDAGESDSRGCWDPTVKQVCIPGTCDSDCPHLPVCGNGVCEQNESEICPPCVYDPVHACKMPCTIGTCPGDCEVGKCGNGVCDAGESDSRGCWDPNTEQVCIPGSCDKDCPHSPICGNGVCEKGEAAFCPSCVYATPACKIACTAGTCEKDCPATFS